MKIRQKTALNRLTKAQTTEHYFDLQNVFSVDKNNGIIYYIFTFQSVKKGLEDL
jgi:hypothetical protein